MKKRLSQPALGPASRIQATAPVYGGVMNVTSTSMRVRPRPGMLVRATAHASGTAKTPASAADTTPSFSELKSASI